MKINKQLSQEIDSLLARCNQYGLNRKDADRMLDLMEQAISEGSYSGHYNIQKEYDEWSKFYFFEWDNISESTSLEDATVKTLSENFDEDEMDMYDIVENMINELNEISQEDGLYWEANEIYDNCAIAEDETDQYMEIFVYKDKDGNIKYSTDEEHTDSYNTVSEAYKACTTKNNN